MYPLEIMLLVSVVMLAIGGVVGLLVGRAWVPPSQQKELEQRLASAREELDGYQKNVARHFMDTSQKVSELTQSYRDLHEHLAKGALELTSTEIGRKVIEAGGEANVEHLEQVHVEPPRDWAPRSPGTHGMLSEEFGLKEPESADPHPDPGSGSTSKKI